MWKKFILDILLPQSCLGCNKQGTIICSDCLSTIEILENQYCGFCKTAKLKKECKIHQDMCLDGVFTACSCENRLIRTMLRKFKREPFLKTLAQPLSFLIISHFLLTENKQIKQENSLLMPMPISKFKKRFQGFSQAEEIAKNLSEVLNIPLLKNLDSVQGKIIYLVDDVFTTGDTMEQYAKALKEKGAQQVWGITIAREIIR